MINLLTQVTAPAPDEISAAVALIKSLGVPAGWGVLVVLVGLLARRLKPLVDAVRDLVQGTIDAHQKMHTQLLQQAQAVIDHGKEAGLEIAKAGEEAAESRKAASEAQSASTQAAHELLSEARELIREVRDLKTSRTP